MIRRNAPPRREPKVISYTPGPRTPAPSAGLLSMLDDLPQTPEPARPAPTAAQRQHMDRVASLGCLLCKMPAQLHHIREGQGMSQRASNWLVVPLCPEHHQGRDGLHGLGVRGFERRHRLSELDLLASTIALLANS